MTATSQRGADTPSAPTHGRLGRWWDAYLVRAPRILAAACTVFGLLNVLHAFFGSRLRLLGLFRFADLPTAAAATAVTAAAGLLLMKLGGGLRRGQRRAWRGAVVVVVVLAVAHAVRDLDLGPLLVSLIVLGLLVGSRHRFTAKADVTSRWRALLVFVQLTVLVLLYGLAMMYVAVHTRVVGNPSFGVRMEEILGAMVGYDGPAQLSGDRFPTIFHGTMLAFGIMIAFVTLLLILRPTHPRAVLSDDDELRLRELLSRQGKRDSLGYFALRRDKSVVWSPTGKAAITYRVVSGVALVSGDPIGDPEAWPGAMSAYGELVREYAWVPAVIGCSETGATVFRRELGLSAIQLGDEAVVPVAGFSLDGRAMRGVRQACTRVQRAGYEVTVRRMDSLSAEEISELSATARTWLGGEVERGFSMALSRMGDPSDGDCVVATAVRDGVLRGMLHFVPWGRDGLSLDLMRRDRSADNGLNELMIVKVIEAAPSLGVTRVSLNFAVFRDAIERGERIGAGPVLRAWRRLLIFLSRWFQIESLYRFNVKFRPEWEPRFLSYPASRDLLRISAAVMQAEAFVTLPRPLARLAGR